MLERFKIINHNGKDIIHADWSLLSGGDFIEVLEEY